MAEDSPIELVVFYHVVFSDQTQFLSLEYRYVSIESSQWHSQVKAEKKLIIATPKKGFDLQFIPCYICCPTFLGYTKLKLLWDSQKCLMLYSTLYRSPKQNITFGVQLLQLYDNTGQFLCNADTIKINVATYWRKELARIFFFLIWKYSWNIRKE